MPPARLSQSTLTKLKSAVDALEKQPKEATLLRAWIDRELNPDGVPHNMPLREWLDALSQLVRASQLAPQWSKGLKPQILGFVRACLRYARPDGSICTTSAPADRDFLGRAALALTDDPGVARVVAWWFPKLIEDDFDLGGPFLPAGGGTDQALACLRADWTKRGEWAAVDARAKGSENLFELGVNGKPWVGPSWKNDAVESSASRPKARVWSTQSTADLFEWSLNIGSTKVTRTAVLMRGQKIAILAEQVEGSTAESHSWSLGLSPDLESRVFADNGAIRLDATSPKGSALAIPLGMSMFPTKNLVAVDGRLVLSQPTAGSRTWLPLLISWDGFRNKKILTWRKLTVAERSKVCPPHVAVASRISFGRDETLVVYRSLAKPALRSFLGFQTTARFVVGWFNREGNITEVVTVEN